MIAIILGNGFEPMEAVAPGDILRRGGKEVRYAAIGGRLVTGGHGISMMADCTIDDLDAEALEMIVIPGGWGGVCSILESEKTMKLVQAVYENGGLVGAICAGPLVLANLGITDGRKAVCYPGLEDKMGSAVMQDADAVTDGRVITARAAGAAADFGLALLAALSGSEAAEKIAGDIVFHR